MPPRTTQTVFHKVAAHTNDDLDLSDTSIPLATRLNAKADILAKQGRECPPCIKEPMHTMARATLKLAEEFVESKAYKRAYEMVDSWVVTQAELDYNSRLKAKLKTGIKVTTNPRYDLLHSDRIWTAASGGFHTNHNSSQDLMMFKLMFRCFLLFIMFKC